MQLLETMTKNEIRELIGKCWITHDGMWFAHTLLTHGIEEANRLNRSAIQSMAEIELKRFMKLLDVTKEQLKDFETFKSFFSNVKSLLIPDFMNVIITFQEPGTISWGFTAKGCFAYNGVKRINVQDQYECGPLYRIQTWLRILQIPYQMTPNITKCVMTEKGSCSGSFNCEFLTRDSS